MDSFLNDFHEKMDSINFSFFERDDIYLDKLLGSGYIGEVYEGRMTEFNEDIQVVIRSYIVLHIAGVHKMSTSMTMFIVK